VIYLDTSCLLKLLRDEPESPHVRKAVDAEDLIIVSSLLELETEVQIGNPLLETNASRSLTKQ